MLYNYYFEVAALIAGLFLLSVYLMRKSLPTRSNKLFFVLLLVSLVASAFDIVSCFSISYPERYPLWLNNFWCLGYLFFYNAMGVLFLAYIDSKTKVLSIFRFMKVYANAFLVLIFVLIFSSPFTHLISFFDENNEYHHGPGLMFLYAMALIHLAVSSILCIIRRRRFNYYQVAAIVSFVVVVFLGVYIQMRIPELLVGNFGCILVLYFIYNSLENPVYYTYRGTACYNRHAFLETMKLKLRSKEDINILAFSIRDFDYYRQSLDLKNIERLSSYVATIVFHTYKERAFCIDDDKFVILINDEKEEQQIRDYQKNMPDKTIELIDTSVDVQFDILSAYHIDTELKADQIENVIMHMLDNIHGADGKLSFAEVTEKIIRRKKIAELLKRAIKDDLFEVFYQPILNVKTNSFESAEALVRLISYEIGFISPEEFIPIAEAEGLINAIGDIVFEKVCKFINEHNLTKNMGVKFIEINLSPIQCNQVDIIKRYRDLMDKYEIIPSWISFEITETASFDNYDTMIKNIMGFHRMGAEFALDDFGSGFASADYLFKLPVEIVKIDKTILWNAMKDANASTVLIGTVNMLKELGKKIVVEGVEDQEMVDYLTKLGVDYLQGYFYSKPVPEDLYLEFLAKNIG